MARQSHIHNSKVARRTLENNLTPRYKSLDSLQAYVEGRQYAGLPHWFDDSVPLLRRAPCVLEPIVESALESYQDLIFGEGRFPKISAMPEEDDQAFDKRFGLDIEQSQALEHLVRAAYKQANVAEVSREALAKAMGERTAVGIVRVVDGRLTVSLEPAKCCTPTFSTLRPDEIESLEIRYPYIELYWDGAERCWAERCLMYRRVVDQTTDTTFKPAVPNQDGEPLGITWSVQYQDTHALGFCPVVWYGYRKITSTRRDPDGIAIHERFTDEIDALNRTISQKHKAVLYNASPQIIETGVAQNEQIGTGGAAALPVAAYVDETGGMVESPAVQAENSRWSAQGAQQTGGGRKKGDGEVWRYASKDAQVKLLGLEQGSLEPLDTDADRLRSLLAEGLSWVRPLEAGSSNSKVNISRLSGKTLSLLYKRQTSQCDTIRPDVWTGWLEPLTNLLLRIILSYAKKGKKSGLYLGGLDQAVELIGRFEAKVGEGSRWFKPILKPVWGPYFALDEQDELMTSQLIQQDLQGGVITLKTAVSKRAGFYGIENIDEYLKTLEDERVKREDQETERAIKEQTAAHAWHLNPSVGN